MDKKILPSEGCLLALGAVDGVVRSKLDGEVVPESERVIEFHELRLGPAYYFPMVDIRAEYPEPSERNSLCAFKDDVRYWTQKMGQRTEGDIAWSNEQRDTNLAANEAASIKALTKTLDLPDNALQPAE